MIIDEIKRIILKKQSAKIALFIRHGEKLESSLSLLSKKGIYTANKFATELKKINCPIRIISSPELRCVQTATIFNSVISNNEQEIILSNKLGCPGLHILNNEIYQKLYKTKKARDIFSEWKAGLNYDSLRNPTNLKVIATEFIESKCIERGITIFISQSGTVANIGYSLNKVNYNIGNGEWVRYLDGFYINL